MPRCLHCGETARARFRECPHCGGYKTIVATAAGKARGVAVRASELRRAPSRKLPTGIAAWDQVLGGGVAERSSILLAGAPGVGKSTHALFATASIAKAIGRDALFLSAEMPAAMVALAGERVGAALDRVLVLEGDDVTIAEGEIERVRPACVVWDSVQTFVVDGASGGDVATCEVVRRSIAAGARVGAVTWLISQLNKDGEPEGRFRAQHAADAVMRLDVGRVSVSKNRFAPAPREAPWP